jgi:hypothetical protein
MTEADVQATFLANARHALDKKAADQVTGGRFEQTRTIRALIDLWR